MALQTVFTVYDQKADAYLPPWIMPRTEMARRVFSDCVNSTDHQFAAHPEDYTLFCLGDWNDETAEFRPYPQGPRSLGVAIEYKRSENVLNLTDQDKSNGSSKLTEATRIQSSSESGHSEE